MILDLQLQVMATMMGAGLLIGFNLTLYDRYILRSERRGWNWVTDGLFWCVQAFLIFILLFSVNGGEWRLYVLLSIICGFAGYEALMKKSFVALLTYIDQIIKWIVRTCTVILTAMLITPLMWIWKLILGAVLLIGSVLCRILLMIGRLLWSPFKPFFQFFSKKGSYFAKKIKKWLNLLYNRE
ncbi:spore cortex biosynthesis protein YabQ [Jeotgalibacillus sp. S-D1]|uniref:spore cortex biosynthesis protein YabQ n=1 Tax=Jeotgalibacillus sp. S-D1 TaxID=2552189 RepID=UPI001059C54B|nr:spore cortex biosynthesis protein YabQ [Jeotgalibacillus sp. S-D1]TDL30414.1 spore cortex biosynthesis protein YabQ [Jeotgalibacillus sp. S-D1]